MGLAESNQGATDLDRRRSSFAPGSSNRWRRESQLRSSGAELPEEGSTRVECEKTQQPQTLLFLQERHPAHGVFIPQPI